MTLTLPATAARTRAMLTVDGNEAVASVAHRTNEVIAIYPITPSSAMGEWADQWSAEGKPNIWGTIPLVVEMQSEGGAAGAVHGALQTGSLCTTFTASQGLLLMIPNLYKIAGELTSTVFHVAARTLATQGLSIFGDHSDVMATRATGWALLSSASVQEAMDLALIAQAATLTSRVPFIHFFDGFRTSHEVQKVEELTDDDLRAMLDDDLVRAHRARGLAPEHPFIRGTAQNPDTYFQAREAANPFYAACPEIVQRAMHRFAEITGRQYRLFEYVGAPDAERVIVLMGSGAETAEQTANALNESGERVGVLKVRLFRPFAAERLVQALPSSVRAIAVLDRTKEPGSAGEPLYQDVVTACAEAGLQLSIVGGRYGLSSKEFTPAMVKAVFDNLSEQPPKNHFTIGINDDLTHSSLGFDRTWSIEKPNTVRALFYGLGSDGTVGANKNSIKIIGTETSLNAQGYFVYDSKKSGSITISHLRFGPEPIHAPYLIGSANFVACHQFSFLERFPVLSAADNGAIFLLNCPFGPQDVWDHLPRRVQSDIVEKHLRFFVIDGNRVAQETGMGGRVNTIMQTCFFALSGVLPRDEALAAIKHTIEKTYGKRGEAVVRKNFAAVDAVLAHLYEVDVPDEVSSAGGVRAAELAELPEFVRRVTAPMIAGQGDDLPTSALPADGTYPSGTTKWEKRNIALEIPVWDSEICIQCDKCVLVCPHAVIRAKVYDPSALQGAPTSFKSADARWKEFPGQKYTLQVAPEDCTGCGLCVEACPVKNKREARLKAINMMAQAPLRGSEAENWAFFEQLPEVDRTKLNLQQVKDAQLLQPLFEFSGACAGCGETPYVKLVSQLFGDRAIIANATGCSSIYGGNLPTTPWTFNREGRGPAWSNSLFEDNAEFGLGFRLTLDKQTEYARELLRGLSPAIGDELVDDLLTADQSSEEGIYQQRQRVVELKSPLARLDSPRARDLVSLADVLVKRSVWIIGGDGWAYDIGFGGLDHVLASGRNVNVLVLDTEVYSNTGGQMSKSTPRGAVAKFAAAGKQSAKKDLGLLAMAYGDVYVARVAMGANDAQTLKAFLEAESYSGPSLIIAYSHCIAHGFDLRYGLEQQKKAVLSGHWPLYRFDPRADHFTLDSRSPSLPLEEYLYAETRYRMLSQSRPEEAKRLLELAKHDVQQRFQRYGELARTEVSHSVEENTNGHRT
ncbi:MAG: pyruvate:ferredoxin (flavodoxin) oxidoreductase [Chloroflexi bacterium]|nr:pyruvate:ferredoxin (flavodoxin) oxidoreductase [Chloroflexota bacterium]